MSSSSSTTSGPNWPLILGTVGIALAGAGYLYKRRCQETDEETLRRRAALILSREKAVDVLRKMLFKWHFGCRQLTELCASINENGGPNGQKLTADQMREVLAAHGNAHLQSLERLQMKVLEEEGVTEEQVRLTQEHFSEDKEITMLATGFASMMEDSLEGKMPILPWVTQPDIDSKALLELLKHLRDFEALRVCMFFTKKGGVLDSITELGSALDASAKAAEEEIGNLYWDRLEVFYSCIGYYSKHSEEFKKEKTKLDQNHRERIMGMFKPVWDTEAERNNVNGANPPQPKMQLVTKPEDIGNSEKIKEKAEETAEKIKEKVSGDKKEGDKKEGGVGGKKASDKKAGDETGAESTSAETDVKSGVETDKMKNSVVKDVKDGGLLAKEGEGSGEETASGGS